ncbi:MAG: CAP domain-containing protein [Pseudomonadota bacterium]
MSLRTPLVSALALAALGLPAHAAVASTSDACSLQDGYASSPAAFSEEVDACIAAKGQASSIAAETQIAALSERHRAQYGLDPLPVRQSLKTAARAHAMDMAARGYASHVSPEGLNHLDRLRRLDRTALFGATGANIAILDPGTDAIAAFNAIISDEVNAENLRRTGFSHMGVGVASAPDGRIFVVQLFAKVDALLDTPMPHMVSAPQSTSSHFVDTDFRADDLWLTSKDGSAHVAHDIVPARHTSGEAAIEMEARLGTATFTLHGPVVTIEN